MRVVLAALLLLSFFVVTPSPAVAQYESPTHLECFRLQTKKQQWIIDDHAFDALSLRPVLPDLGIDRSCELLPVKNPRPKEICFPALKSPQQSPFGSSYLADAMLCYDARCDAALTDEVLAVAGQFGGGQTVARRKMRTRRLCVPATLCHDVCEEGPALHSSCGECAARVCDVDPFCCQSWWTSSCAARAAQVCAGSCPGVPTASPTPIPTQTPVATPTSIPGPACSTAKVTTTIVFDAALFPDVAGVTVRIAYPKDRMSIPGSGGDPRVFQRVTNLTGSTGGLFSMGDDDFGSAGSLNIGLIDIGRPIPPGPFAAATFDCEGNGGPNLVDLGCSVDVVVLSGFTVPASCHLALETVRRTGSTSAGFLSTSRSLFE